MILTITEVSKENHVSRNSREITHHAVNLGPITHHADYLGPITRHEKPFPHPCEFCTKQEKGQWQVPMVRILKV